MNTLAYSKMLINANKNANVKSVISSFTKNEIKFAKVFWKIKKWTKINVQKWNYKKTFEKNYFCYHKLKLTSHHQNNNLKFVTIIFSQNECVCFRRFLC